MQNILISLYDNSIELNIWESNVMIFIKEIIKIEISKIDKISDLHFG